MNANLERMVTRMQCRHLSLSIEYSDREQRSKDGKFYPRGECISKHMNTLNPSDRSYWLYRSSDTSSYLCKLDIPTLVRSTVSICYRPCRSLLSRCICCCLNWSGLSHCNLCRYYYHCILSSQWSTKSISHKFYPLAQSYPDKCTCYFLVQNDLLICM